MSIMASLFPDRATCPECHGYPSGKRTTKVRHRYGCSKRKKPTRINHTPHGKFRVGDVHHEIVRGRNSVLRADKS